MRFTYDHYYAYDELSGALKELAQTYPDLVSVQPIGKSGQGRDILVATVTTKATGCDGSKPGFYVDGNHHAGEVTGSMVALTTLRPATGSTLTSPSCWTPCLSTSTHGYRPTGRRSSSRRPRP
jgi:murein tripeptide amidase MpaA